MKSECENESAKSCITIYCDAAPNKVSKIVNRFGKKMTYDNGGYRAGILLQTPEGDFEQKFINQKCPDQFRWGKFL